MIYMRECANKEGDLRYPNVDMCSSYVDSHHHHECHCVWIFDLFDFWEIVWYCVELFWEESVYEVIVWTVDNLLIYINIYQSHLTHFASSTNMELCTSVFVSANVDLVYKWMHDINNELISECINRTTIECHNYNTNQLLVIGGYLMLR